MDVRILDDSQRWLVLAVALASVLAALCSWRFSARRRGVVVASVVAWTCLLVLLAEAVLALAVHRDAPAAGRFNDFHWVLLAPWQRGGLALGALAGLATIVLAWRASARMASPFRRAALIGLRTGAVICAFILFLQPAIELRQVAREPNRIAILVDESRSMNLSENVRGPRRIERARRLLERSSATFEAWRERHRIDVFSFADTLVPSSLERVATDPPNGPATMIRQALEQLYAHYDASDLAGVVLISDGVATGGLSADAGEGTSRDFLESLDTRVHTVWVGRPDLADVAIARVLVDEFAFVRSVVRIEAVVRATGVERRRIPVILSSEDRALRQKWVDIGPGDTSATVVFELSPPRVGKFVYRISTPVAEDEAVAENNQRSFVLRVIRDKIRVLQVAGQPSWDVRALRRMLDENPNVDLISFFILRTFDDHSLVPNQEMSLIPFPTRELFQQELPSFDVIIMQNFDFGPYGIGAYLENIRRYVAGGGGFIMLGGPLSFSSGGYAVTPLADALPVELPTRFRTWHDLIDHGRFTPVLTKEGEVHPVTALRYETRDNRAAWQSLPELEGVNILIDAKPGATVLAEHPRLSTRSGKPMPVFVAGEYGDGRTMAITTDSLWRWGFVAAAKAGDDGRHYDKLWENIIRWLIQDPELAYLHVHSDAVEYQPGGTARLAVRLLEHDYTPLAHGQVTIGVSREVPESPSESILAEIVTVDEAGHALLEIPRLEPGIYRVKASAQVGDKPVQASDIFLVRDATTELDQPAADEQLLRSIAAATKGTYLATADSLPADLAFAEPRIVRVDQRADVELWSRPSVLILALIFLGLEWILRQRSGFL